MSSAKKVDQPADPDPSPVASGDTTQEVQGAARQSKKKAASQYSRMQTILAGNSAPQDNGAKKTILGG